jgi:PilZ domain
MISPHLASLAPENGDRRQDQRVSVVVPLQGHLVPEHDQVTLQNVSEGGCSLQAPSELPIGAIWEFRFGIPRDYALSVRGRVVHTTKVTAAGHVAYLIGVEFVDDGSEGHRLTVQRLLRAAQRLGR